MASSNGSVARQLATIASLRAFRRRRCIAPGYLHRGGLLPDASGWRAFGTDRPTRGTINGGLLRRLRPILRRRGRTRRSDVSSRRAAMIAVARRVPRTAESGKTQLLATFSLQAGGAAVSRCLHPRSRSDRIERNKN
jgi:hypothetical protein